MERELVLVVDDESVLREMICQVLSKQFEVITASDGKQAIELATTRKPKVILLDILMPDMNGVQVCEALRNTPVGRSCRFIMVTALNDSMQKIAAFNAGADDFIEKPFKPAELLARVSSKMRRIRDDSAPPERNFGNMKIDFSRMCLTVNGGASIKLGLIELKILNSLLNGSGKVVTRKQLSLDVWGDEADRVVDPHITSIRKKIDGSNVEIKTVYGEGYSIIAVKS